MATLPFSSSGPSRSYGYCREITGIVKLREAGDLGSTLTACRNGAPAFETLDERQCKRYHDYRSVIMVRTQIQLTEEQSEKLKAAAARRGISMAALIRQGIDTLLSQHNEPSPEDLYRRAARAAGAHHSGTSDTASRHDDYLAEEFRS